MSLFGIWCHKLYRGSLRFSLFFKCLIWFLKKVTSTGSTVCLFTSKAFLGKKKKKKTQAGVPFLQSIEVAIKNIACSVTSARLL